MTAPGEPQKLTLDYAPPAASGSSVRVFAAGAAACAVGGIAFNIALVTLVVRHLRRAAEAYDRLTGNPRAFGRLIDLDVIASLERPVSLYLASGLLAVAAVVGFGFAMLLLLGAADVLRGRASAADRLRRYVRWKPLGAALTVVAFFWMGHESLHFWVAASRHWPVGAGPPFVTCAIIALGAMAPRWLVQHGARRLHLPR